MSLSYISPEDFQSLNLEKEKLEQKLNDLNQIIESISSGLENPINQIISLAKDIGELEYQKRTIRIAINALSKFASSLSKSTTKSTTKSTETASSSESPFNIGDTVKAKKGNLKFKVVKIEKRGKGWRIFENEENYYRSSELTLVEEEGIDELTPDKFSIPQNSENLEKSTLEELTDPWNSEMLEIPAVGIETPITKPQESEVLETPTVVIEPPTTEPQESEVLKTPAITIEPPITKPQESEMLETSTIAIEPPITKPQKSEVLETPAVAIESPIIESQKSKVLETPAMTIESPVIESQESKVLETPAVAIESPVIESQESEVLETPAVAIEFLEPEKLEEVEQESAERTELPDGLHLGKGIKLGMKSLQHQDLMAGKLPHVNTYSKKEWIKFAEAVEIPTQYATKEILRDRIWKEYQKKADEAAGKQLSFLEPPDEGV